MSGALRLSGVLGGLLSGGKVTTTGKPVLLNGLKTSHQLQQTASMLNVTKMEKNEKPPPFPYREKKYTRLHLNFQFVDITQLRMDVNSKIVTVESNIGTGKAEFAKELAERFGMFYMPEPRIEDLYVNHTGFDYRTLNQYIHPKLQAIDEKMFYENPAHEGVPWYKIFWYRLRYAQYIDALAHLFNTGQGVVLERAPQSDMVFADAMVANGALPRDAYDYYYRLRYDTIHWLLRPHLIIYLDAEPDVLHKRIKDRGIPYLSNSKLMTKKYLSDIDNSYKDKYLNDASQYSELLVYKWNTPGDMDEVVADIEKLEMDDWDCKKLKFKDWNLYENHLWDRTRFVFTREKIDLLDNFNLTPFYDTDSIAFDLNDSEHRDGVYKSFVPNYRVQPDLDPNTVGFFRSLLGITHWRRQDDFNARHPFY